MHFPQRLAAFTDTSEAITSAELTSQGIKYVVHLRYDSREASALLGRPL